MKKILFLFSAVTVLLLLQGCFSGYHRSVVVIADYDERCWYEGHWVYRIYEGDRWIYRHWYNNRWENDSHQPVYWQSQKWERKAHNERDDGRRYENDKNHEEIEVNRTEGKKENKFEKNQDNHLGGGHK